MNIMPATNRTPSTSPSPLPSSDSSFCDDDDEDSLVEMQLRGEVPLRPYQRAILAKATRGNVVALLPTGTGKTLISIRLIKQMLYQTVGRFPKDAKRTVFLAPTRVLVEQQCKYIKANIPEATINYVHGGVKRIKELDKELDKDVNVEAISHEQWIRVFQKLQILVFTPEVFYKHILLKGFINIADLNLIVFDEVHHALKRDKKISNHPYRGLMDFYKLKTKDLPLEKRPRILGMTATLLNPDVDVNRLDQVVTMYEDIFQATVESDDTSEFIKEAKVYVVVYNDADYHQQLMKTKIMTEVDGICEKNFEKVLNTLEDPRCNGNDIFIQLKKAIKKVAHLLYSTSCQHQQMGPWFASEALKLYMSSLVTKSTHLSDIIVSVFDFLRKNIVQQYRPPDLTDLQWTLNGDRSDKLASLLKLLSIFKDNLNCIIFVKERTDANLLYRWLLYLSKHSAEFGFLKPGFIYGSPEKGFIRFDKSTPRFKEGFESGQLNVMVATSVLEEGIDVPTCNLVIRYDVPTNFRAYTQSKGRARDRDSYFIMLAEKKVERSPEFKQKLQEFQKTEDFQRARGEKNEMSGEGYGEGDWSYGERGAFFVTSKGAILYEKDAMSYLHAYIQRLPSDYFTVKKPTFAYIERVVNSSKEGSGDGYSDDLTIEEKELENGELPSATAKPSTTLKYIAVFMLPINSSLTGGFVCGDFHRSKTRAKASCAFKVCQMLHERGEIDDHLNIISTEFLLEKHFAELNLKVIDKTKPNYREEQERMLKKAIYERETSQFSASLRSLLPPTPSQPTSRYHFYLVDFPKLDNPVIFFSSFGSCTDSESMPCSPVHQPQQPPKQGLLRMGFLIDRKLPLEAITSLVYLNKYQLKMRVAYQYTQELSPARLEAVRYFANHLQQHVLLNSFRRKKVAKEVAGAGGDVFPSQMTSFFTVPVRRVNKDRVCVNFELIEELRRWQTNMNELHQGLKNNNNPQPTLQQTTVEQLAAAWPAKTIFACYHRAKPMLHFVDAISEETALSTFNEKVKVPSTEANDTDSPSVKRYMVETTYAEFYHNRYGIKLQQPPELPLMHAFLLESTLRALCKFGITYTVAKLDRETKCERREERELAKMHQQLKLGLENTTTIEKTEENAATGIKRKTNLNFPAELMRPYPLPFYYYVMLNAFPVVLYRLESYLLAVEYLQKMAASAGLTSAGVPITEDSRLPGSLLTAEYYNNQRENVGREGAGGEETDEEVEEIDFDASTLKTHSSDCYQLINIDDIDGSAESVKQTSSQETALIESITAALPGIAEQQALAMQSRKTDDYFDRLLERLKAALEEVVNAPSSPSSSRGTSPVERATSWRRAPPIGESATPSEQLDFGDTSLFHFSGPLHQEVHFNTFDLQLLPNPWYVVKAFTLKKAGDIFNLEQLETVGDAFLKMSSAMYLYFLYLNYDEGKLSQLKSALVCNENLFRLAVEAGLPRYAHGRPLAIGESWVVPFVLPVAAYGQYLLDGDRYVRPVELKYKQVADLVEALIGACLVYGSAGSALAFFRSIGLPVFDPTAFVDDINPVCYYQAEMDKNFKRIEERFPDPSDLALFEQYRVDLGQMVEEAYLAGGKFKQVFTALYPSTPLVQAFTHPSYTEVDTSINGSTNFSTAFNYISSFQRLEFIGDAVLDYLITFFVYQKNQKLLSSEITNLRASLVNNVFYSSIVIKYNMHTALRCSSVLLESISLYVKKYKCNKIEQLGALINDSRFNEVLSSMVLAEEEGDLTDLRHTDDEVPKSLADIFEALIGAIYIDNGFDLDALWLIVYRLIKVEVDYFSKNIPVNVLHWLEMAYSKRYRFENLKITGERTKQIELKVLEADGTERVTIGHGSNKAACKVAAARRFRHLKKKEMTEKLGLQVVDNTTMTTTTTTAINETTFYSASSTPSSASIKSSTSSSSEINIDIENDETDNSNKENCPANGHYDSSSSSDSSDDDEEEDD